MGTLAFVWSIAVISQTGPAAGGFGMMSHYILTSVYTKLKGSDTLVLLLSSQQLPAGYSHNCNTTSITASSGYDVEPTCGLVAVFPAKLSDTVL